MVGNCCGHSSCMEQYGRGVGVRGEMERRKVLRKVGGVAERQICKDERD